MNQNNRKLSAIFERSNSDKQSKTVPAVISTDAPVERYGIFEVLTHTTSSVDLSRFPLPVIVGHDSDKLPIAIAENPQITGGKLRVMIRFSDNEQGTQIFNDVVSGIITNLSIGYAINNSHQEMKDNQEFLIADAWTPYECSIVAIPADANAGFNRNFQTQNTNTNTMNDLERIKNEAVAAERQRIDDIKLSVRSAKLPDAWADKFIKDNTSIDLARKLILDELVRADQLIVTNIRGGADIPYGNNNFGNDNLHRAVGDALLIRAGIPVANPSSKWQDFKHTGVSDIAKMFLDERGESTIGLNQTSLLKRAFETSSDFVGILDNIQNKAMANAYKSQASTIDAWTSVRNTNFFQDTTIVNLGEMPSLAQIFEGAEYTYGSVDSVAEKVSMAKWGKIFSLSWESLRKDDLSAFLTLPARFGESAKRAEASLSYKALTSNPVLSDGKTFFHATRGNLQTTPAALSLSSLAAARAAMRKFKGIGGLEYIDAIPTVLLVPVALETLAEQIVASITATKASDVTPEWVTKLKVVADPRLDDISTKDWYLFCDPNAIEGFARVYLDGNPVTIEQNLEFERDGMKFKCRLAMGVGAVDWRAAYKTVGA